MTRCNPDDYHMQHRPSDKDGAPLHDLTRNGVYPKDVYDTLWEYRTGDDDVDRRCEDVVRSCRGKPNELVKIYRAVPHGVDTINPGDWVTISRAYAYQHAQNDDNPENDDWVLDARVPASTLFTDGNSLAEWGYHGQTPRGRLSYKQLLRKKRLQRKARRNPRIHLEAGEDPDYGSMGVRPADRKAFNFLDGRTIAHDLLEHMDEADDITGEFRALGAMCYVRGTEYYAQRGSLIPHLEYQLSGDMIMFFPKVESGEVSEGNLYAGPRAPKIPGFDEKEFLANCKKAAKYEFTEPNEDDMGYTEMERFMRFCKAAIPWLRKGYSLAAKKYGKYGRRHMLDMFTKIENAVQKYMPHLIEGQQFIVDFDLDTGRVYVEEYYGEEEPEDL